MMKDRLTHTLFALLAAAMICGAVLLGSGAPLASAAPLPVLTASAEPPTPTTVPPTATTVPPTVEPNQPTPTTAPPPPADGPPPEDRRADPAVSKEASKSEVAIGEEITFSITVTNEGNDTAQGVIVEDPLPGFLKLVSASIDKGQAVTNGNTAGFWIGDVEPGEVIRGSVTARVVDFPGGGEGFNEVVLRSNNRSDRPVNNRSSVRLRVTQPTPTPEVIAGQPEPTPTPEVLAAQPTPPPPSNLPVTASDSSLPYGLIFLAAVAYMGAGLYLWLRPRRRP
jgi:uncharacterized repeat protein (TIGR01451 family)